MFQITNFQAQSAYPAENSQTCLLMQRSVMCFTEGWQRLAEVDGVVHLCDEVALNVKALKQEMDFFVSLPTI